MEALSDPLIVRILSYLTYYEISKVERVNKQFCLLIGGNSVILVKPPNGIFVRELVELNEEFFDEMYSQLDIPCNGRFLCPGFNVYAFKQILKEEEQTYDENVYITLKLFTHSRESTGVVSWVGEDDVTLSITGYFNSESVTRHDVLYRVSQQISPGIRIAVSALTLITTILDVLFSRILHQLVQKQNQAKIITLDLVREVIPLIFVGDVGKHALYEGNKHLENLQLVFDVKTTDQILSSKLSEYHIEEKERVAIFMTGVLEYISAELLELACEGVQDVPINNNHVLNAIKNDLELRDTIKVREIDSKLRNKKKPSHRFTRILKGKIVEEKDGTIFVETEPFQIDQRQMLHNRAYELHDFHQDQTKRLEGVIVVDNLLSKDLHESLMKNVEKFSQTQNPDYHPGSNNMVRDYVHPGLYSYIDGVSDFVPSKDLPENPMKISQNSTNKDLWGRAYESSRFQWLPTYIDFKDDCWHFRNEINNLPKLGNEDLYRDLEKLIACCVPHLEHVVGYARALGGLSSPELSFIQEGQDSESDISAETHIRPYKLQSKSLQVICKIVDYELQPGQSYEGVWHVEGMSHENIVATADYIAERDDSLKGGKLLFKRAYLQGESYAFSGTGQERAPVVNELIAKGFVPIGTVQTHAGRLIVFPNSHVHKISRMKNEGSVIARRRIIVFFFINPQIRIISTQEVTPASQVKNISYDDALKYRLELMDERKFHKQDFNVREINLCEH